MNFGVSECEKVPEEDKLKELRREWGEENIHLIIRRLSRLMCRHGRPGLVPGNQ